MQRSDPRMNPSPNLFLIGPSGAGKSSAGRLLARRHGLTFIDLDSEIEKHTGVTIATIFEIEGESGFREREAALLDSMSRGEGIAMATGAGAVLNPNNRRCLTERGLVLWLDVTIEQQLARLSHDHRRPLLAGVDRRQRLQEMAAARTPLYQTCADLRVNGRDEPPGRAIDHIDAALAATWRQPRVHAP
jgi:shikimate kinase